MPSPMLLPQAGVRPGAAGPRAGARPRVPAAPIAQGSGAWSRVAPQRSSDAPRARQACCQASSSGSAEAAAASGDGAVVVEAPPPSAKPPAFTYKLHSWSWRGHTIKYTTVGCGKPLVLVHGFGASAKHWRFNLPVLAQAGYKVYALDLLGFGGSDKPVQAYTVEVWAEQVLDFMDEFVGQQAPAVLVGNSLGSLVALMVSADPRAAGRVAGTALLNCAGGMNNKAIADDWRIKLAWPLFMLIDWLLAQRPIAQNLFDRFRAKESLRNVLTSVYPSSAESVDEELLDLIHAPSCDDGALDAFVSVVTGPPGPRPEELIPRFASPLLLLWGDKDGFTPMDGPVGRFFQALPAARPDTRFVTLPGAGHCPHDEVPDAVHAQLLPWLREVFA